VKKILTERSYKTTRLKVSSRWLAKAGFDFAKFWTVYDARLFGYLFCNCQREAEILSPAREFATKNLKAGLPAITLSTRAPSKIPM